MALLLGSPLPSEAGGDTFDEYDAEGRTIPDVRGRSPNDVGWYGPIWETDGEGALLGSVSLVSYGGEAEQWLVVTVQGLGLEYGWSEGPYPTGQEPLSIPVALPSEAHAEGLVAVYVLLQVTDPETGELLALQQTPAAYVLNAGIVGERWFSLQQAESAVVRDLRVPLQEGEVIEGVVGLEVSP